MTNTLQFLGLSTSLQVSSIPVLKLSINLWNLFSPPREKLIVSIGGWLLQHWICLKGLNGKIRQKSLEPEYNLRVGGI